jgi:hypothetical protein
MKKVMPRTRACWTRILIAGSFAFGAATFVNAFTNGVVFKCDTLWGEEQQEDSPRTRPPTPPSLRDFEKAFERLWTVTKQDGLERVWSTDGDWWSAANDRNSGLIYVLGRNGQCAELNASGDVVREFELQDNTCLTLRVAQLSGKGRSAQLLTFSKWVGQLKSYDFDGNPRWNYRSGINDICPVDVDGDGADEVVIGFNGNTGLHVLTSEGKVLWQADGANLWHVSAGDVLGVGVPQVLTTASGGKVHIFGQDGKKIRVLDPGFHATLVVATNSGDILVAGKMTLASLSCDGEKNWSMQLPFHAPTAISNVEPNVHSAHVAKEHPRLAIASDWGEVFVVDTTTGRAIGHVNGQGRPQVCWAKAETGGVSLLVIATGKAVNAFRVSK